MKLSDFLNFSTHAPFNWALFYPVLIILIVWSLVWKGFALWRSARNSHTVWFVVMLIVNTVGILEIIYLLTAGRRRQQV